MSFTSAKKSLFSLEQVHNNKMHLLVRINFFQTIDFIYLHRTLTHPRRMFSTWKNLMHKVLNESLKCTTYMLYQIVLWVHCLNLQTHRDRSWSNSILDTTFTIYIYFHLIKIIRSPNSSLRHKCIMT